LFNGSEWTGEDVLLVLEMFKVIGHMGDGLENVMLGFLSSILPSGNTLSEKLGENKKTTYFYQQAIKSGHGSYSKLAIFEIQSCRNGCSAFIGDNLELLFCSVCDEPNDADVNHLIYYFPLADRLCRLLTSDLKKFFNFIKIRKPPAESFFEDVYDGENYKWFLNQMNADRYLSVFFIYFICFCMFWYVFICFRMFSSVFICFYMFSMFL